MEKYSIEADEAIDKMSNIFHCPCILSAGGVDSINEIDSDVFTN